MTKTATSPEKAAEIKNTIISHFRKNPGKGFKWSTLGIDRQEGIAAWRELREAGILVDRSVPTKSGKRRRLKTFLAEGI